jgi:hypothetical protein
VILAPPKPSKVTTPTVECGLAFRDDIYAAVCQLNGPTRLALLNCAIGFAWHMAGTRTDTTMKMATRLDFEIVALRRMITPEAASGGAF